MFLPGCSADHMKATAELTSAVIHPNYDSIQEAAEAGANMDTIWVDALPTNPILCLWETMPRPLFIEQMLKNGSDVNWADHNGNTLLMYASGYQPQKYGFQSSSSNYSELDYCKLFLQYGADVSKQNKDGWTALDYAVQLGGGEETVEVLLSYGTTVTPQVLQNALDCVNGYTDYKLIRRLVSMMDSSQTNTILSPILDAAIRGENETVQRLAQRATALSADEKLQTLCYAATFCDRDTMQRLLSNGFGTLSSMDASDNTLLAIAAAYDNADVLSFLLGQQTWSQEDSETALSQAINNDCAETCGILLNAGTPVITGTTEQWEVFDNIMDGAAQNGNVEIMQMLILHGYPLNNTTAW